MARPETLSRRGKSWQGRLRTWNTGGVRAFNTQVHGYDPNLYPDEDLNDLEIASNKSRRKASKDSNKGPSSPSPRPSPRQHTQTPQYMFEKEQKRLQHIKEMQATRELWEEDKNIIRDKCTQKQRQRELKFERMIDDIKNDDKLRVNANHFILEQDANVEREKRELHAAWHRDVHERIQYKTFRTMNPNLTFASDLEAHDGRLYHDDDLLNTLTVPDDPVNREREDAAREDAFHRYAMSTKHGLNSPRKATAGVQLLPLTHEAPMLSANERKAKKAGEPPSMMELDMLWSTRETSRPVLEPNSWDQLSYGATPHGFIASSRLNDKGQFNSQRRFGIDKHLPPGGALGEEDGIVTAGTTKTRFGGANDVGMLTGDWNKLGYSSLHKHQHGPSCGAPSQDHYTFDRGVFLADAEFPLGKRCWKHAS